MTGPEHYKAAEDDIEAADARFEQFPEASSRYYQSAQAHATLALVEEVRALITEVAAVPGAMP